MEKYGSLFLSTAPALTISSAVLFGAGFSTPAHAATGSVAKGGFWGAVKWLFSGAMMAAAAGALTVYMSASIPLRYMQHEERKAALKKERNRTVVATLIAGALWTAAYEFTTGWAGPVLMYQVMMGIIIVQTIKMQNMILADQQSAGQTRHRSVGLFCGRFGLYAGLLMGNAAMFYGLYQSGRLF